MRQTHIINKAGSQRLVCCFAVDLGELHKFPTSRMVFGSPFGSLYHQRIGYPSRNTDPYEGLGPPFLAGKGSPKEDHGEVHFCGVRFLFTTGQTSGFFLEAGRVQPRRRQQLKKAANDLASFRPSAWTFRPTKFASDISGDASLFSWFSWV